MISLAAARGVYNFIENPMNSILYPHMEDTLTMLGFARFISYGGAFGWRSVKAFEFRTTLPADVVNTFMVRSLLQAKIRLQTLVDLGVIEQKTKLAKLVTKGVGNTNGWSKQGWVTGNKRAQRESALYTEEFCESLADMVMHVTNGL